MLLAGFSQAGCDCKSWKGVRCKGTAGFSVRCCEAGVIAACLLRTTSMIGHEHESQNGVQNLSLGLHFGSVKIWF